MNTRTPMDNKAAVAGIVLCGGQSSRMGSDKSRLEYRGQPLFEHMRNLLRQAGIENTFLSGPDGIQDILPGRGPLGGMHACMHALAGQFSHALFVPTDMPLLSVAQLRNLAWHSSDAEALYYREQVFPLRLSLLPQTRGKLTLQLMTEIESGRSIKNFIRSLQTDSLPIDHSDLKSFANINTPQEWHTFKLSRANRVF
jgi:molybdopterin-guanine dinucleotide biosynthesis protein A